MKAGLIIQGPIASFGRSGASIGDASRQEYLNFNCEDTILKYVTNFKDDFEVIVLSTWADEGIEKLDHLPDLHIVRGENQEDCLPRLSINKENASNNKIRQYRSLLNGIKFVENRELDLIVKVRTDQFVNANQLLVEASVDNSKFWTPLFHQNNPDYLDDFYMASNPENLKRLCELILSGNSLYRSPHLDLFYSYLFTKESFWGRKKLFNFFRARDRYSRGQWNLILNGWEAYFDTFSVDIFSQQVWRGEKISPKGISTLPSSKFEKTLLANNPTRLNCFHHINWKELILYFVGAKGQVILQQLRMKFRV